MTRIALLLSFCLGTLLGFCNLPLQGNPNGNPVTQKDSTQVVVKDTINTSVSAPNSTLQGTVEVSFRIDQSGHVEIVNIKADNAELIEYVISRLKKINLDPASFTSGKTIHYKFEFKKQA